MPPMSEEEIHHKVAEAARVAVANALAKQKEAASTREREIKQTDTQGNAKCG